MVLCGGEAQWDDAIGYFMKIGSSDYEGLFKYDSANNQYGYAPTQLNIISEDVYGNKVFYGKNGVGTGTLQNITNLSISQAQVRANVYSNLSYLELNENITDLGGLFGSSSVSAVPNMNTSNIVDMQSMFSFCQNLTSIPNFDTSNVTNMAFMLHYCENLTSVPEFNMTNVTDISNMFEGCNSLSNLSLTNIVNSIPNASQVDIKLIYNVGIPSYRFSNDLKSNLFNKGYIDCDQNTSTWSTQYNINGTLYNRDPDFDRYATTLYEIIHTQYGEATSINISSEGSDNGIVFALPDFQFMSNIEAINIGINTCNVTKTADTFSFCTNLTSISNFDTSNITNMYEMFICCENLTSIPNFDTSNVTSMCSTFAFCNNLQAVTNLNAHNVTNMYATFKSCLNLTNVYGLHTNKVNVVDEIFFDCQSLTSIPDINTTGVTSTYGMFYNCYNLLAGPQLNTSDATDMHEMFINCYNLTTVPNYDTSNATDLRYMFCNCTNLVSVPDFNTDNAGMTDYMFCGCTNMTTAPQINTASVYSMYAMFENCHSLISAPNYNVSSITSMTSLFANCTNLVNVPEYDTSNITEMIGMFRGCNNLSDASIQNIINMCINSSITAFTNLSNTNDFSPLYDTKFDSSYYQNRWSDLTNAGWTFTSDPEETYDD